MFCSKCGSPNNDNAAFCAKCGASLAAAAAGPAAPPAVDPGTMRSHHAASTPSRTVTGKNPTVALVLSIFLGAFGAGQFYNGDWKKGLVMLGATLILGVPTGFLVSFGIWIWSMVDAYQVASGKWPIW